MTLAERLAEYVRAAFTRHLGPVRSSTTTRSPRSPALPPAAAGPWPPGTSTAAWPSPARPPSAGAVPGAADPLAAIRALGALATPDGTALLVLRNFHRFLGSVEVVQALDTADRRRQAGPHLRRRPRPGRADPRRAGEGSSSCSSTTCPAATSSRRSPASIATEPGELPEGDGLDAVLDAAAGLTRLRGRERLQPLAGPPRPARPGRALGAQGQAR